MEEMAKVTKILGNGLAEVELRRHSACGDCGQCGHSTKGKEAKFEVGNPVNAEVGDMVVLEMQTKHLLSAVFLIYMLPLINLVIGFVIGNWLNKRYGFTEGEAFAAISGVVFLALTFLCIKLYDRHVGEKSSFRPWIKQVVSDDYFICSH